MTNLHEFQAKITKLKLTRTKTSKCSKNSQHEKQGKGKQLQRTDLHQEQKENQANLFEIDQTRKPLKMPT